jgi:hypothetical protein
MREKNPSELRESAQNYRNMSSYGDDFGLKVALLQLANEFEYEAERLERSKRPQTTDKIHYL